VLRGTQLDTVLKESTYVDFSACNLNTTRTVEALAIIAPPVIPCGRDLATLIYRNCIMIIQFLQFSHATQCTTASLCDFLSAMLKYAHQFTDWLQVCIFLNGLLSCHMALVRQCLAAAEKITEHFLHVTLRKYPVFISYCTFPLSRQSKLTQYCLPNIKYALRETTFDISLRTTFNFAHRHVQTCILHSLLTCCAIFACPYVVMQTSASLNSCIAQ